MSRVIKFRGWVKHPETGNMMMRNSFYTINSAGEMNCFFPKGRTSWAKEVMQFTGLHDKNGKEIYEGDIVKVNHPQDVTGDFTNSIQRVFFWEDEGGFYHGNGERPPKRMWEYCKVIGNIYENGELLE